MKKMVADYTQGLFSIICFCCKLLAETDEHAENHPEPAQS